MNDIPNLNDQLLNYSSMVDAASDKRVNKIDKNINSVQDYKLGELENFKDKIDRIHAKLMAKKSVSADG